MAERWAPSAVEARTAISRKPAGLRPALCAQVLLSNTQTTLMPPSAAAPSAPPSMATPASAATQE